MDTQIENMLIDQVDDNNQVIGRIPRRDVFVKRVNFRVVHVLVFDSRGRILLQNIAPNRPRHPHHWGSSVAGYMNTGESYEEASRRKMRQELGLTDTQARFVGTTPMLDEGCKKFIGLFTKIYDGTVSPDPEQIEEIRFWNLDEIVQTRRDGGAQFTPTFLHLLDNFESQLRSIHGAASDRSG